MHANEKGLLNGYIGNDNRQRAKDRHRGNQLHRGTLNYLACDTRDLVLPYQNTIRDHYPAA